MLGEPKLKEGMHEIQEKISKMEKDGVEKISEQNSRVETTLKKQETAISSRVFFFARVFENEFALILAPFKCRF